MSNNSPKSWATLDLDTQRGVHAIIGRIEGMPSQQQEFRCTHEQAQGVLLPALKALVGMGQAQNAAAAQS